MSLCGGRLDQAQRSGLFRPTTHSQPYAEPEHRNRALVGAAGCGWADAAANIYDCGEGAGGGALDP